MFPATVIRRDNVPGNIFLEENNHHAGILALPEVMASKFSGTAKAENKMAAANEFAAAIEVSR